VNFLANTDKTLKNVQVATFSFT